jgi:DNA-binding CsgD family transcriptional regulator
LPERRSIMNHCDDRLLRAIEAIYDAAPDPLQWPRALAEIANCFGDVGAILIWRRDDDAFGTIVSESLREAQRDYVENGWAGSDIKAVRSEQKGYFFNGEPFTDRHICSEEDLRDHTFQTQFMLKHGLGWIGAIAVSPDPHIGVMLSIQRDAKTKCQYSESELNVISLLGRHIEKSLRLSIRLLDAELVNLGLGQALARIGIGVFALDSMARVVFSNPAGQRLAKGSLDLANGRLCVQSSTSRHVFDDAVERMLRGNPKDMIAEPKPILVHSVALDQPLIIYVLPVAIPNDVAGHFLTSTRAIVLVIEQKPGEPADPAVVRDLLGLTLGEARVAALIGSGMPPREAAGRLGIAEETARNVLKRVFGKVGISRQSELVALLSKLVLR